MSDKIARLKAELALEVAQAEFVEKKKAGTATLEDRLALRELRQDFRDNHRSPVKDGAQPGPISAKAKVK